MVFRLSVYYFILFFQLILDEYDLRSDVMRQRLSKDLFIGTVDSLVEGSKHLNGLEWEAVVLVKWYCVLALTTCWLVSMPSPIYYGRNSRFLFCCQLACFLLCFLLLFCVFPLLLFMN